MLLGVSLHSDLTMAPTTLEVESINPNTEVVLVQAGLLSHVEFGSNVEEIAANVAPHTHGQHHSDIVLLVTRSDHFLQFSVIEVWWVILVKNFPFRHMFIY